MGQKINLNWVQFKNSRTYTGCDYIMRIGHCMTMFPVLKQNHGTQKFKDDRELQEL
jgi:mannose/fructose/N-acetylgalactosamine-specific phosphotransferase system component IID